MTTRTLFGSLLLLLLVFAATATALRDDRSIDDDDVDDFDGLAPMRMAPPMRFRPMMRVPLSTYNLTTRLMRAAMHKNVMLLLLMTDARTMIAYNSDLTPGGLYKGRRGVLELAEAVLKEIKVSNCSYKIINVDEERSTAAVELLLSGVSRKTNATVTARKMLSIKYALQRVANVGIIDLNNDEVKEAVRTPAEKAYARLSESWFTNGPLASATLSHIADNVSFVFGAVSPKTLLSISGKATLIRQAKEKSDACKLLELLWNHTTDSHVVHADNSRVVTINFVGDFLRSRSFIDRFSEGTILHGVDRIHTHHGGVTVFFLLQEFDNDGKLTRSHVQLSRPLTLLDRMHLRNVHGITITAN